MNFAYRRTNTAVLQHLSFSKEKTKADYQTGALNVLLLQGPSGPFFRKLENELTRTGFSVNRVVFNDADRLFSGGTNTILFSSDLPAWDAWLHARFRENRPDIIILFGSSRPAHAKARELAKYYGILVIALEEGYLRSGYISCEISGNNQFSPLALWQPAQNDRIPPSPLAIQSSLWTKCFWVALYYGIRELGKTRAKNVLSHRSIRRLDKEIFSWMNHICFSLVSKLSDKAVKSELFGKYKDKFLIVPLQTPNDSQIRFASRGWNNKKLILSCLRAAKQTSIDERLVFKTHPLDERSSDLKRFIEKAARKFGLNDKVNVISSGKLSELVPCSSGMIVINSTAAFSALHSHKPLLVMGEAVFRHEQIITVGNSAEDIVRFIKKRHTKCPEHIKMFIRDVKINALVPGDFYQSSVLKLTAKNVAKKVATIVRSSGVVSRQ